MKECDIKKDKLTEKTLQGVVCIAIGVSSETQPERFKTLVSERGKDGYNRR